MCYILALKPSHDFTKIQLSNAYNNNKDNAGFAYVKEEKVIIHRGYKSFENFYSAYSSIGIDCPRLIHFTNVNKEELKTRANCHPFEIIRDHLCMAQAGTVFGFNDTNDNSEAKLLVKEVIKPLMLNKTYKYVCNSHIRWLLDEAVGPSNKMVFLDKDGMFTIINPQTGYFERDNNVWFNSKVHDWVISSNKTMNNEGLVVGNDINVPNQVTEEKYDVWLLRIYHEYVKGKAGESKGKAINSDLESINCHE